MREAKALATLRICADSHEHSLLADAISTEISRTDLITSLILGSELDKISLHSSCSQFIVIVLRYKCILFSNNRHSATVGL